MFEQDVADVYDLVYRSRGKDFEAEAAEVAELVRSRKPDAESLLDVGCGTGEHLLYLRKIFGHVEGLELAEAMRVIACRKLASVTVHAGDMRTFELGRRFDCVSAMFTAIGYVGSVAEMQAAIARMAAHLNPGGVLVIDPWWFPETFLDGYIGSEIAQDGERTVARVGRSTRHDRTSRLEIHYIVADIGGIRHFTDTQALTLFTREEYLAGFDRADCDAEYVTSAHSGRGLFVGVRRQV
ncbi:class I SAM-dependent methyltransferase [Nonomuraea jiangxiensis]|uniref:dTDP-3-amino-3,6-dideoxy-alpha-D-glucopyranose N,N-dimethyltransferase/dTDP-3-amino-3,4,6-trideoxy-alpha-D-glucopyranose N,N-dimethyltransferase/N-dimethyltransferase n=1 Tax=Nonomuraea jiangxiensis TaxID=633440 RepID=A0A1G8RYW6_9ACTN|nr:class I SAM-dependent methyltransferase [Nonomuraea jiangxiensis]SDJ22153.1 dTDP-3-amino-3,6-dideoxy-alpha-D-glucopyranose N,N-dimethyltransferase/dTDP-3-amino-3,4,6-trideoxy-alpha-D-glucopyranose N,N-dimethyltransferase/N-dimethyltransferase [Nonomuraea jiangxiensis]